MLGLKILKKNYLLKVLRVLFKTLINNNKNKNNLELIYSICKTIKYLIPKVAIN